MNILIWAAHPDDEVLGIGGAIARWTRAGHKVATAFMTDGIGSRGVDQAAADRRRIAAGKAAEVLGSSIIEFGKFPDNQLDTVPLLTITQAVERVKRTVRPDAVYTHFWGDLNIDHRRTLDAVLTAFRPQPGERCHTIGCFEVASATEWGTPSDTFRPNHYIELSADDVEQGAAAYLKYEEEVRAEPHTRSVEAWRMRRMLRGREIGVSWAEGLMICRQLHRISSQENSQSSKASPGQGQ
jgi:N-acetylglucosamine malate deacetylase 1